MGKGTRQIAWDTNKQETVTMELEVFELKWLPILLGGTGWTAGVTDLFVREEFTGALSVTLGDEPKAGSLSIWQLEVDNIGQKTDGEIVAGDAANAGEYSIVTDTLTMNAAQVGQKLVAYYMKDSASTAESYSVKAGEYPTAYSIDCITTIRRQHDGVDEEFQFHIGNARPMADMEISFSETEPTTLSVVFDLFPDADGNMITFKRA